MGDLRTSRTVFGLRITMKPFAMVSLAALAAVLGGTSCADHPISAPEGPGVSGAAEKRGTEAPSPQSIEKLPWSPTALAISPDETQIYVACATANQIAYLDLAQRRVSRHLQLPLLALRTGAVLGW